MMGDRYELDLKCAYCGEVNKDIWYAPTCESIIFNCKACKKRNYISSEFKALKMEEMTLKDIKKAFINATNVTWYDDEIDKMCEKTFKRLKNNEVNYGKKTIK